MLPKTPVLQNLFFLGQFPHAPGQDPWGGSLTDVLQLYKPAIGEQGWGEIVGHNFAVLDRAMLRDWDQVVSGTNEFSGRVSVRHPQKPDEAARRQQLDNLAVMSAMGGY